MGTWGLCLFRLAGTATWMPCQSQVGTEGSLSLEKQVAGFGPRAWAALGLQPSFLPFLLKPLSPDTPSHYHLLCLSNLKPCFALSHHALETFGSGEAASGFGWWFFFFFLSSPDLFCSLSDPLSHFPYLDIASIYTHIKKKKTNNPSFSLPLCLLLAPM